MRLMSFLLLAFVASACRSQDKAELLDADPAQVAEAQNSAKFVVDRINGTCAAGGCHGAQDGRLSQYQINTFIRRAIPMHYCFESKSCYAEPLPADAAKTCFNDCIKGRGGLAAGSSTGLFHATVRGGIVDRIATAAGAAKTDMRVMPPSAPAPTDDLALPIADFRKLMDFALYDEMNGTNYVNSYVYSTVPKVKTDPVPALDADCDTIAPAVTAAIDDNFFVEDFKMFGCPKGEWSADPTACFSGGASAGFQNPDLPAGVVIKELRGFDKATSYWTRSSPDGRFVSPGNGTIEDLATPGRTITVQSANIDPAYAPNGKFYIWPGLTCPIDPLLDASLTAVGKAVPASKCLSDSKIGTYSTMGGAFGGDTVMLQGSYDANFGGGIHDSLPRPTLAKHNFIVSPSGRIDFDAKRIEFELPGESSAMLSPSGRLLVTRFAGKDGAQKYRIRRVKNDAGDVDVANNSTIGTICLKGEKAMVSYDDRFIAVHHLPDNSPQDAGGMLRAHANIFVYDLKTKKSLRLTNMKNGEKAFFPHFRADGWLYFLVKRPTGDEAVYASNIALVMKAGR